jgi:phosphoadenosine phosphosulfate reductase
MSVQEALHPQDLNAAFAADAAARLKGKKAEDIIAFAQGAWGDKFAIVSSFGAESAVLLHLVAQIDRNIPVIFLETDRHFAQTLAYRDELIERLGLTNVVNQRPDAEEAAAEDPKGDLWRKDSDACCALRKVRPLDRVLSGYEAWATGRKRFQGGLRANLAIIEFDGVHFKVNPLAEWTPEDIAAYTALHDLPAHPLVEQGFPSIGCWPCTKPAESNDRSGRWAGTDKTECGIHTGGGRRTETLES